MRAGRMSSVAVLAVLVLIGNGAIAQETGKDPGGRSAEGFCSQLGVDDCVGAPQPGATPAQGCAWTNDGECDEPEGTGLCPEGTDVADCRVAQGCAWTNDGECDEPEGTGLCPEGTDAADCAVPQGVNSCARAFDGICDESRYGAGATGLCPAGTDTADCAGGTDDCARANNGICDEARRGGTGLCPAGSDTTDCGLPTGPDSCELSRNGECNEARFGGEGACPAGTDGTDCAGLPLVSLFDPCPWTNDGECDEAGGTGLCAPGTDSADCRAVIPPGTCPWTNDGECDEPGGTGLCAAGTDAADCAAVQPDPGGKPPVDPGTGPDGNVVPGPDDPGGKPDQTAPVGCEACDCSNVSPTDLDCVLCCHDLGADAGAPPPPPASGDGVCDGTPYDEDCTITPGPSVSTAPEK